jgi:protoheme IX farnesyltransferase
MLKTQTDFDTQVGCTQPHDARVYCSALLQSAKPRIALMVAITCAFGFFLGTRGIHNWPAFFLTLLGTLLSSGGAAALNNLIERDIDAKMDRTSQRALPLGILSPSTVLTFGVLLVLSGVGILVYFVNLLTGFLALLTAFLYVIVYTPLKRLTWWNTSIGAIPGAIPPLGGWAASTGNLGLGGWALFLIMFIWQHPHFYAIALMYKDDYAKGGFKMLPVVDATGRKTFTHITLFCCLLIHASLIPVFLGLSGYLYAVGALGLGIYFLHAGMKLQAAPVFERRLARSVLLRSLLYLPGLFVLSIADLTFRGLLVF